MKQLNKNSNTLPKLVSFKLCPFVQQVSVALTLKKVLYEVEYIDLANPPAWFIEKSPFKKVPMLIIEDHVLFDSIAILEFIEDKYYPKLFSENIFVRAHERALVQFLNEMTWALFELSFKKTKNEYQSVVNKLHEKIDILESFVQGQKFFNNNSISIIDVVLIPIFQRLDYLESLQSGIYDGIRHRNVFMLKNSLMNNGCIDHANTSEMKKLYYELLVKRAGYISSFIKSKNENIKTSIY